MSGRVFVVGSVNTDMVMHLPRLPRWGETVLDGRFTRQHGGKGANQAVAAARLEVPTSLIGAVGADEPGDQAVSELLRLGVNVEGVCRVSEPTGVAFVIVGETGENMIGVAGGANLLVDANLVRGQLSTRLRQGDVAVANLEVDDEAVREAAAIARRAGAMFVLNPAPARSLPAELLADCHVLTPNELEVGGLGYRTVPDLLATGVGAVVVTRSAQGADLYRAGRPALHQEPFPADVVDTTGAGDAFTAALACGLASGESLESSLRWAAAAGALATRALGARAGYADGDELRRLVGNAHRGRQLSAAIGA